MTRVEQTVKISSRAFFIKLNRVLMGSCLSPPPDTLSLIIAYSECQSDITTPRADKTEVLSFFIVCYLGENQINSICKKKYSIYFGAYLSL